MLTPYAAAKSAVEGLARAWADELGADPELDFMNGTTCNAVSVGFTDTDSTRYMPSQVRDPMQQFVFKMQSLGSRLASAEDIADAIGFLCGNDSRWITGQTIGLNGGFYKAS